jgi:hypothetical protein
MELMEIRDSLLVPEKIQLQRMGATYWSISLSNLIELINHFVGFSFNQVVQLQACKDEIMKFEKLRSDLLHRIKSQAAPEEGNHGGTPPLSKEKINLISLIYGSVRFILTRLGRVINMFDNLQTMQKKKRMASSSMTKSKQPPAIRKIQQLES